MDNERIIELINKEIDGTILPAERVVLEQYCSGSTEVQEMSRDFNQIASMLREVKHVDPPSTLKARVMREIAPEKAPHYQPLWQVLRTSVVDFFQPRTGFRFAYAFSGGVLAGIALFALFASISGRPSFESGDAIGTMISSSARNLQLGREFTINAGGVSGAVTTQHSEEISVLTVNFNASSDVVTHISYDPASLTMKAVRRSEDPGDHLVVRGGEIELSGVGNHTFAIYFGNISNSVAPVRVTILSSGNSLFDNTIALGPQAR